MIGLFEIDYEWKRFQIIRKLIGANVNQNWISFIFLTVQKLCPQYWSILLFVCPLSFEQKTFNCTWIKIVKYVENMKKHIFTRQWFEHSSEWLTQTTICQFSLLYQFFITRWCYNFNANSIDEGNSKTKCKIFKSKLIMYPTWILCMIGFEFEYNFSMNNGGFGFKGLIWSNIQINLNCDAISAEKDEQKLVKWWKQYQWQWRFLQTLHLRFYRLDNVHE